MHKFASIASLGLCLLAGACAVSQDVDARGTTVYADGVVDGFIGFDGLTPWSGKIFHFGALGSADDGEIVSMDVWPLVGVGVGVAGARARVLPLEVGPGVLFYDPTPLHEESVPEPEPGEDVEDVEIDDVEVEFEVEEEEVTEER